MGKEQEMTRAEAIAVLKGYIENPLVNDTKAFDMAIQALENIGHLKDRPCDVCEFRKENGCCKWDCVFD